MEEYFDTIKFISLVQSKESIWNYKSEAYANKALRKEDWLSICEAMVEDFGSKSNTEKNATAIEFQAKWKVLRDGFTRSMKNFKKKGGTDGSKSKLYTYYTPLKFLNGLYKSKESTKDSEKRGEMSTHGKEEKRRKRQKKKLSESSSEDNESFQCIISQPEKSHSNETKKSRRNTNDNDFDEDKQFLLSLLSDFRKIPSDQKLDAKGDIINVIRHYKSPTTAQYHPRGSFFEGDIAAVATAEIDRPTSCGSSYFEQEEHLTPTEVKYITHS